MCFKYFSKKERLERRLIKRWMNNDKKVFEDFDSKEKAFKRALEFEKIQRKI